MGIRDIRKLSRQVAEDTGKKEALLKQSADLFKKVQKHERESKDAMEALKVLQKVAVATQEALDSYISNMVTMALHAVDPLWPEFRVETVIRNNQSEMDMYFMQNGVRTGLKEAEGGGPLDVSSFALKTVVWTLKKIAPVLFLDEPFKFVSPDLQHKVSAMLKMMIDKLEMQIIMVSHAENINVAADKTFIVTMKAGKSTVKEE